MILSQDRSGWFGASDTSRIMSSWETTTFWRWWLEKQGVTRNTVKTAAVLAGTHYEHRVLDALGIKQRDRQIRIKKLRLRVNLDGEDYDTISEVKTHKGEFRLTKAYWQQAQVEMYAAAKWLRIVAYQVGEEEYHNYFLPIDHTRIAFFPIPFDPRFIKREYLPRLKYLAFCLERGKLPSFIEFSKEWMGYASYAN